MLDSKLKGEYDLEGYKVEFVQVNIVGNVVEYRITYVSSTEQQIIFEL